jgi:rubrerythrin
VKLGVQIEKNGMDFYNALVNRSKDKKASGIFRYLAGEEEKHISVFQKLLNSIEKYEPAESYPNEYFAYMNALAGDHVFTKEGRGKEIANKVKSDKEAIELGIGFEKDSIIFYEGMKKAVLAGEVKIIEQLILQEESHLQMLQNQMEERE